MCSVFITFPKIENCILCLQLILRKLFVVWILFFRLDLMPNSRADHNEMLTNPTYLQYKQGEERGRAVGVTVKRGLGR